MTGDESIILEESAAAAVSNPFPQQQSAMSDIKEVVIINENAAEKTAAVEHNQVGEQKISPTKDVTQKMEDVIQKPAPPAKEEQKKVAKEEVKYRVLPSILKVELRNGKQFFYEVTSSNNYRKNVYRNCEAENCAKRWGATKFLCPSQSDQSPRPTLLVLTFCVLRFPPGAFCEPLCKN